VPAVEDKTAVKIALFMESEVTRYGVEGMLRSLPGVAGVTSCGSGEEAICAGADSYDLVVMPGTALAGMPRAPQGQGGLPPVRLLLLIGGGDAGGVPGWADPWVRALVDWSGLTPCFLAEAITDVMSGRFFVSPSLARRVLRPPRQLPEGPPGAPLTPREYQVLLLVAEGLSNKHVARRLEISEHGAKRLVSCVLAKLNCPNRTLAVVRAIERGLLPDPGTT
jgi:DNA-binding NarL/FixJ family response regulator